MEEETAYAIADWVLLAAAGAATWVILRDPRLRRATLRLLRTVLTGTIPAYISREVRTAWEVSGQHNRRGMMAG